MEAVLNNGFCEMSQEEGLLLDGGVNWWAVGSGVFSVAGGIFAGLAATASPEPISKTYGYWSAGCWIASGVTGIISAF